MASSRNMAACGSASSDGLTQPQMENLDVAQFSQEALRAVMMSIKHSNELFSSKDEFDFYSSFDGFCKVMQVESAKIKELMSKIFAQQGIKAKLDSLDVDEIFEAVVDANDIILERVGNSIDEATGLRKSEEPILVTATSSNVNINTSWNKRDRDGSKKDSSTYRLLAARNILRPQLKFKTKVNNNNFIFEPIITEKPNSIKPLAIILEKTDYGEMFVHPYQCELDHFQPGDQHLHPAIVVKPKAVDETPLVYISTVENLKGLCDELKNKREFAVDLEHHSYRTFQGITCLMQISTREKDYIIDTLELRSELQILNEVFTDPKILKVFHGADSDIEWLQRDFGIYVVNMFDTGQASRLLSFAHFSLAFLLKHYCKVDVNKQFQLADWRMRPLPEQMILYAREDTHYLLYIYDSMKNELLEKGNAEKNLLLSVFQRSKVVCEKRYIKPIFKPDHYLELSKKSRKVFNSRQLYALRELYVWRDKTARIEDESIGYVLPNHMLLQIAEVLPREMQGILACCNPVPTLVRQNLNELHQIVLRAREQSLVKPVIQELQMQAEENRQIDVDNVLHCPHDFSHLKDMGAIDTGPTLLDLWNKFGDNLDRELNKQWLHKTAIKKTPSLAAFDLNTSNQHFENQNNVIKTELVLHSFHSPFERYKLVHPLSGKVLDSSTDEKSKTCTEDYVDEVQDHFKQLLQIHGKTPPQLNRCAALPGQFPQIQTVSTSEETSVVVESSEEEETVEAVRKKGVVAKSQTKTCAKDRTKLKLTSTNVVPEEPSVKKVKFELGDVQFRPFDYTQTDASAFKGGAGNKNTTKKGKKNCNADKSTNHFKQSKTHLKGKAMSLTYSSRKQNQANKSATQWPKR